MKKLLLGITVLALVVFTSSAIAAGPKVPKALCLVFTGYSDYHELAFKALGNVSTNGGIVKMYMMSGYAQGIADHPVHGSGYVIPGTTTLHATYNGQGLYAGNTLRSWELSFNLATNSGTLFSRFDYENNTIFSDPGVSVTGTDCSTQPIPTGKVASGVLKAQGE